MMDDRRIFIADLAKGRLGADKANLLARRFGRQGVNCAYELLLDVDAPEETAGVRLIDVAELAKKYDCDPSFVQSGANFVGPSCAGAHEPPAKQPSQSTGEAV